MLPSSIEFYINLLASFGIPLLSNRWLLAGTVAVASLLIISATLKHSLKIGLLGALLFGGMAFALVPQQLRPDIPSENRGNSGPTSTGLYGAPGSSTNGVYIGHSKVTNCGSIVENHGTMANVFIEESRFDCPPKLAAPPGVALPAHVPDSLKGGNLTEPSKPLGTSGMYNSPGAVTHNVIIDRFTSIGCENSIKGLPNRSVVYNTRVQCGGMWMLPNLPPQKK
jgi:hypothetical protein